MRLQIFYDDDRVIRIVANADSKLISKQYKSATADFSDDVNYNDLIGKKVRFKSKENKGIRLALICNIFQPCGISVYSRLLAESLLPKLADLKIFSEVQSFSTIGNNKQGKSCQQDNEGFAVDYCWERGKPLSGLVKNVLEWKPDCILIQHEYGLFSKANYFLPMMEGLSEIPTLVTLHSVYEHLDKSLETSCIKNIIVHSKTGEHCLRRLGHLSQKIDIVPHGCVDFGNVTSNWPMAGKHSIMQFGFGFSYKGVETVLEAVSLLRKKLPNIFYSYFSSENPHTKNVHDVYYNTLKKKIEELDLRDHASIQRGFFTEEELNNHLRTFRLAVFPYISQPGHKVWGASGACRIAMANNIATILSSSPMFDDLEGVLPRPHGSKELADTIHKVFSDNKYESEILKNQRRYIESNNWSITADRYIKVLNEMIVNLDVDKNTIIVEK
jgi:glycosyltransferase involved in cell wall biosynthesis